jgi:trehalose-6-phosphate synthase
LLKKIIEKHNLGDLPWEELSLLGGIAEDALFIVNKVKQKKAKEKAKTALGQKAEEEKKEEKAEEKKKEEHQVKPDVKSLREKLKQIYANAGV